MKRKPSQREQASQLKLAHVIGLTAPQASCIAYSPGPSGVIAYPAGCLVVIYSPREHNQWHHLRAKTSTCKPLQCTAFSADGKHVAGGESGAQGAVVVWDLTRDGSCVAELKAHKYGVASICFSPDGKLLASAGSGYDGQVCLWNWRAGVLLSRQQTQAEIRSLAFGDNGSTLLSAGKAHCKAWKVIEAANGGRTRGSGAGLAAKATMLPSHKDSTFVAVASMPTGGGYMGGPALYALTSAGVLMLLRSAGRSFDKLVDVQVREAFSLAIGGGQVAVAGADSAVRIFAARTLTFKASLPRPAVRGHRSTDSGAHLSTSAVLLPTMADAEFPDAMSCSFDELGERLAVAYSDRGLVLWDVRNLDKVVRLRSMHSHSGGIWDIQALPTHITIPAASPWGSRRSSLGAMSGTQDLFATCASDGTLRIWDLGSSTLAPTSPLPPTPEAATGGLWPATPGRRTLRAIIHAEHADLDGSTADHAAQQQQHRRIAPETLLPVPGGRPLADVPVFKCVRVSPDGHHLAAGDSQGNLYVYELHTLALLHRAEAHDTDILSVDFTPTGSSRCLLASGGRDGLIHLYDAGEDYALVQTLSDHSGAVSAVRFADGGRRLLSCGADRSLIFRQLDLDEVIVPYHKETLARGIFYSLEIAHSGACQELAVTASQDRRIKVWEVATGKALRSFQGDNNAAEPLKVALDPGGCIVAASHSDLAIRLYDLATGAQLASAFGHSEVVAGLAVSADCSRLVSVGGDGCICVWELPPSVVADCQRAAQAIAPSNAPAEDPPALEADDMEVESVPRQRRRLLGWQNPPPGTRPMIAESSHLGSSHAGSVDGSNAEVDDDVTSAQTAEVIAENERLVAKQLLPRWAQSPLKQDEAAGPFTSGRPPAPDTGVRTSNSRWANPSAARIKLFTERLSAEPQDSPEAGALPDALSTDWQPEAGAQAVPEPETSVGSTFTQMGTAVAAKVAEELSFEASSAPPGGDSPMPDWAQLCEEDDEIVYYVPNAADSEFTFDVKANPEPDVADGAGRPDSEDEETPAMVPHPPASDSKSSVLQPRDLFRDHFSSLDRRMAQSSAESLGRHSFSSIYRSPRGDQKPPAPLAPQAADSRASGLADTSPAWGLAAHAQQAQAQASQQAVEGRRLCQPAAAESHAADLADISPAWGLAAQTHAAAQQATDTTLAALTGTSPAWGLAGQTHAAAQQATDTTLASLTDTSPAWGLAAQQQPAMHQAADSRLGQSSLPAEPQQASGGTVNAQPARCAAELASMQPTTIHPGTESAPPQSSAAQGGVDVAASLDGDAEIKRAASILKEERTALRVRERRGRLDADLVHMEARLEALGQVWSNVKQTRSARRLPVSTAPQAFTEGSPKAATAPEQAPSPVQAALSEFRASREAERLVGPDAATAPASPAPAPNMPYNPAAGPPAAAKPAVTPSAGSAASHENPTPGHDDEALAAKQPGMPSMPAVSPSALQKLKQSLGHSRKALQPPVLASPPPAFAFVDGEAESAAADASLVDGGAAPAASSSALVHGAAAVPSADRGVAASPMASLDAALGIPAATAPAAHVAATAAAVDSGNGGCVTTHSTLTVAALVASAGPTAIAAGHTLHEDFGRLDGTTFTGQSGTPRSMLDASRQLSSGMFAADDHSAFVGKVGVTEQSGTPDATLRDRQLVSGASAADGRSPFVISSAWATTSPGALSDISAPGEYDNEMREDDDGETVLVDNAAFEGTSGRGGSKVERRPTASEFDLQFASNPAFDYEMTPDRGVAFRRMSSAMKAAPPMQAGHGVVSVTYGQDGNPKQSAAFQANPAGDPPLPLSQHQAADPALQQTPRNSVKGVAAKPPLPSAQKAAATAAAGGLQPLRASKPMPGAVATAAAATAVAGGLQPLIASKPMPEAAATEGSTAATGSDAAAMAPGDLTHAAASQTPVAGSLPSPDKDALRLSKQLAQAVDIAVSAVFNPGDAETPLVAVDPTAQPSGAQADAATGPGTEAATAAAPAQAQPADKTAAATFHGSIAALRSANAAVPARAAPAETVAPVPEATAADGSGHDAAEDVAMEEQRAEARSTAGTASTAAEDEAEEQQPALAGSIAGAAGAAGAAVTRAPTALQEPGGDNAADRQPEPEEVKSPGSKIWSSFAFWKKDPQRDKSSYNTSLIALAKQGKRLRAATEAASPAPRQPSLADLPGLPQSTAGAAESPAPAHSTAGTAGAAPQQDSQADRSSGPAAAPTSQPLIADPASRDDDVKPCAERAEQPPSTPLANTPAVNGTGNAAADQSTTPAQQAQRAQHAGPVPVPVSPLDSVADGLRSHAIAVTDIELLLGSPGGSQTASPEGKPHSASAGQAAAEQRRSVPRMQSLDACAETVAANASVADGLRDPAEQQQAQPLAPAAGVVKAARPQPAAVAVTSDSELVEDAQRQPAAVAVTSDRGLHVAWQTSPQSASAAGSAIDARSVADLAGSTAGTAQAAGSAIDATGAADVAGSTAGTAPAAGSAIDATGAADVAGNTAGVATQQPPHEQARAASAFAPAEDAHARSGEQQPSAQSASSLPALPVPATSATGQPQAPAHQGACRAGTGLAGTAHRDDLPQHGAPNDAQPAGRSADTSEPLPAPASGLQPPEYIGATPRAISLPRQTQEYISAIEQLQQAVAHAQRLYSELHAADAAEVPSQPQVGVSRQLPSMASAPSMASELRLSLQAEMLRASNELQHFLHSSSSSSSPASQQDPHLGAASTHALPGSSSSRGPALTQNQPAAAVGMHHGLAAQQLSPRAVAAAHGVLAGTNAGVPAVDSAGLPLLPLDSKPNAGVPAANSAGMPLSPLDSKQSGAEYTLGRLASPSAIPRSPYSPSPFASRHSFLRASVTPSVGDASIASYESLLEEHADRLANDYFTCLSGKLEARLKSMVDEKLQQLTPSKPSP